MPPKESSDQFIHFPVNGAWLPDLDPAELGPENFRLLRNMRYNDRHPEGIQGYTKINTTALSTHPKIRSGIQFRTNQDQDTYTLVQSYNEAEDESKVYQNQTDIPDQGDFESTALHTDASGAGAGRFSKVAGGNIVYCNGVESCIWGGEEMRVAGFYTGDDASMTNPEDHTEKINNVRTATGQTIAVGAATQPYFLVFSTRPLQGVKLYISSANASASTLAVTVWNGASFAAVSNSSDGTTSGGVALAQTGSVTFDSTVDTAAPYHFQGLYLYAYRFYLNAGNGTIYHVTVDAPWQDLVNVWDGIYRQPIQFQVSSASVYEDYTLEVNESSYASSPIGGLVDGLLSTDFVEVMFEERVCAMRITMLGGLSNTNASIMSVSYWSGSAWVAVSNLSDGTAAGGKTLNQSGLVSWTPPAVTAEIPINKFSTTGYLYKFSFSATLSGTKADATSDTVIDLLTGIPAQKEIPPFKFAAPFKNRVFLFCYTQGKEGGRADYSMSNATDVWNGSETSMNGLQSLFFGGVDECNAATQLYNRFGSNIFSMLLVFKNGETYVLIGDGPEDYVTYPISFTIGCPAPKTLATAEVGFEMAENVVRNVAMWLDYAGPMMFDGAVLAPMDGIKTYFDPANTSACINYDAIDKSCGWYDPTHKEYNLLFPSGSGQTTPNKWLVYDLVRKKWYQKDTGAAAFPQLGFTVMDSVGVRYMYAGIDDGFLMRLENGTSWNGTGITQELITGDLWPTGSVWDLTRLVRLKLIAKKITENHSVAIQYYADTAADDGVTFVFVDTDDVVFADGDVEWGSAEISGLDLTIANSLARLVRKTMKLDDHQGWCHAFGFRVTTSDTNKGFQPIGWGVQYQKVRSDRYGET